jgi:hypothetical protein
MTLILEESTLLQQEANIIADKNIIKVIDLLASKYFEINNEYKNNIFFEAGKALEKYISYKLALHKLNKQLYYEDNTFFNKKNIAYDTDFYKDEIYSNRIKYYELKSRIKEEFNIDFNIDYWNKIKDKYK